VHISRAMADQGIAVLRFDFTGLGDSEGDFSDSAFSANVGDLLAAATWLEQEYQPAQILVGHSLGGTAALAAAQQLDGCRAVATINAPAEPSHILHHMAESLSAIEHEGAAFVNLGGRPFRIKQSFVDDVRRQDVLSKLKSMHPALLVLHAPLDKTVSVDDAQKIFQAARHPKSFISLDRADHLLSDPADSKYAGLIIASWARRYLDGNATTNEDATADDNTAIAGAMVSGRTEDGFTCRVHAGKHNWLADEPERMKGKDLGPDPYAHLCAALGTCTVMTLNMYARHKQLPVTAVQCHVTHDRIHASDCEECQQSDGKIDVLQRRISISGDLSDEQRQRMLEIADRCPVHRTLENEIKVRSELADSLSSQGSKT
jgi:putative redox protein